MNSPWKKVGALAGNTLNNASQALASAQDMAGKAGSSVLAVGRSAGGVLVTATDAGLQQVRELGDNTVASAGQVLAGAQEVAGRVGSSALQAGRAAGEVLGQAADAGTRQARALAEGAAAGVGQLKDKLVDGVRSLDAHHETIAARAEDVSMAAGVVAGVAAAGAFVAAPSGLAAAGVAVGVASAPLIVTAAPVIGAVATAAGAVSGATYFYARWKKRKPAAGEQPPVAQAADPS